MANTTFTGDGLLDFYGTNAISDCVPFNNGDLATQIVGLVPCFGIDTIECTTDCFTVPAVSGDNNSFYLTLIHLLLMLILDYLNRMIQTTLYR